MLVALSVLPCRVNDLDKLQGLRKFAKDKSFQAKWRAVKQEKKKKLAALIKSMYGDDVPVNALFDIHVSYTCMTLMQECTCENYARMHLCYP